MRRPVPISFPRARSRTRPRRSISIAGFMPFESRPKSRRHVRYRCVRARCRTAHRVVFVDRFHDDRRGASSRVKGAHPAPSWEPTNRRRGSDGMGIRGIRRRALGSTCHSYLPVWRRSAGSTLAAASCWRWGSPRRKRSPKPAASRPICAGRMTFCSSGKKCAGILAQTEGDAIVAGIGINVGHTEFPDGYSRNGYVAGSMERARRAARGSAGGAGTRRSMNMWTF